MGPGTTPTFGAGASAGGVAPWGAVARHYLVATVACVVLSAVYEAFSHGVISAAMVGAFAWPLVLGWLPAFVLGRRPRLGAGVQGPAPLARQLWGCGVLTLTLGSIVHGVVEIYGTTTPYGVAYWVAGAALLVAAACLRGRR